MMKYWVSYIPPNLNVSKSKRYQEYFDLLWFCREGEKEGEDVIDTL